MITPNLTYEEYSALPGFNASLLKTVDSRSLRHARAYMDGELTKESDALDFGTSFHELLLRGRENFVVHPETYPASKTSTAVKSGKCKEGDPIPWDMKATHCKEWVRDNGGGGTVWDAEEADRLRAMVAAVKAHPELAPHLVGQCELAVTAEQKGQAFKSLVDLLPDDPDGPVIDFKKCRSCNPRTFVGDALKFGYPIQAALNLDVLAWNGVRRKEFWFVAVEEYAPFVIWIMKLQDTPLSFIRVGRRRYRAAAGKLAEAIKLDRWPAYEEVIPEELAPAWMKDELEQTL